MKLMKVMSEARFLAGEDARGVLVVLEPETDLSDRHLGAILDCGAAGFVSDGSAEFFDKPDVAPELVYDRGRFPGLLAFSVPPRFGVTTPPSACASMTTDRSRWWFLRRRRSATSQAIPS